MIDADKQEKLKLLVTLIRSYSDGEISAEEAAAICRAAAEMLHQLMPMARRWYVRMALHSGKTALHEAAHYFEELIK